MKIESLTCRDDGSYVLTESEARFLSVDGRLPRRGLKDASLAKLAGVILLEPERNGFQRHSMWQAGEYHGAFIKRAAEAWGLYLF